MTTPVSNIPVSIDYTNRDYYGLREALIQRVKARVSNWEGNDPSDFGVALIESFAYMGDLINYYIDRIANESYLGTATQRQNVLNLASMLGYTAGGYTSATVNLKLTTTEGYRGQIGGSQLVNGTAQIIVPNDNSLAVGSTVNVSGLSRSEYNGTFIVTDKSLGNNELSYIPANYTVTAVGYGTHITYTTNADHIFEIGQFVTINNFPTGSTSYNQTNKQITGITHNTFTIAVTGLTGTPSGSGVVVYADIAVDATVSGYVHSTGYTTVPAGTQISVDVTNNGVVSQIIFTTLTKAIIPFINDDGSYGSQSVLARHGVDISTLANNIAVSPDISGELLGYSSGEADQSFALIETEVDTSTISVYVENGNVFDKWTPVQYLEDYSSTDKVYKIKVDSEYNVFIEFGDGIGGAIPTKDQRIKAVYLKGAGLVGNIPAQSSMLIYDVPGATTAVKTNIMSKVKVSNTLPATGGDVPESLESIRHNAPKALRALNRAVTLEDFESLALSIPGVGKANAVATLPTSVVVYIAPDKSELSTEITPGINSSSTATDELTLLKTNVLNYISNKTQIGTTVSVLDPKYTYVEVAISYTKTPGYDDSVVKSAIKSAIVSNYSYNSIDFQATITPQLIEKDLRSLNELSYVQVVGLHRKGGTGKTTLAGDVNEIFVFIDSDITLTAASNVASLTALTVTANSVGLTLSPTFSSEIYQYSTSTTNSTVVITPTVPSPTSLSQLGQTISVNNNYVDSGSSVTVTLATGSNTIPISVTAPDGVTTNTYVLTVVK